MKIYILIAVVGIPLTIWSRGRQNGVGARGFNMMHLAEHQKRNINKLFPIEAAREQQRPLFGVSANGLVCAIDQSAASLRAGKKS